MAAIRGRRTDLVQFLRSRRARIAPGDVGLPPGLRRRTPGLRREEVAQLAGVGVTWYTWLEQGRPINAIAGTLRLDPTERQHLYRLAHVPATPEPPDSERVTPELQMILDSMTTLPAAIYNSRYDLLAWNDSYQALFPALVEAPRQERNALWQMLLGQPCCCPVSNRDEELPPMVATLRGAFARHVGEPTWTRFIRRLSAASPEFAQMWAAHDVADQHRRLTLLQDLGGRIIHTSTTSLTVPASPETRVVVYTPAGADDRALLEQLTSDPANAYRCPAHRSVH